MTARSRLQLRLVRAGENQTCSLMPRSCNEAADEADARTSAVKFAKAGSQSRRRSVAESGVRSKSNTSRQASCAFGTRSRPYSTGESCVAPMANWPLNCEEQEASMSTTAAIATRITNAIEILRAVRIVPIEGWTVRSSFDGAGASTRQVCQQPACRTGTRIPIFRPKCRCCCNLRAVANNRDPTRTGDIA
jgi:hypothetical protein